jgi:hypothetical protein
VAKGADVVVPGGSFVVKALAEGTLAATLRFGRGLDDMIDVSSLTKADDALHTNPGSLLGHTGDDLLGQLDRAGGDAPGGLPGHTTNFELPAGSPADLPAGFDGPGGHVDGAGSPDGSGVGGHADSATGDSGGGVGGTGTAGSGLPAADPAWAHHPSSRAPLRPALVNILDGHGASGHGWERVDDSSRVESTPYPGPRPHPGLLGGDFAPEVDAHGHAVHVGDAATMLDADGTAPYGHRPDGTRYEDGAAWSRDNVDHVHGQTYGTMHWAPNDGAVFGSRVRFTDLTVFDDVAGNLFIDRLGDTGGSYLGLGGGTFAERALPPSQLGQDMLYHLRLRAGAQLPTGWSLEVSRIASAYGQPGGGLQMVVRDAAGRDVKLDGLEWLFEMEAQRFDEIAG